MKISAIEARDLSEAWFLCLRRILTEGREYKIERGSYAGQLRKELEFVVVQIKHPGTRPLVPDVPQGVPPPSTMEYIEEYLPYLMTAYKSALRRAWSSALTGPLPSAAVCIISLPTFTFTIASESISSKLFRVAGRRLFSTTTIKSTSSNKGS